MFAGNFAPAGWMTCDGQTLSISEFETLFNLIGTTYGGDGMSTFALPNLSGRAPMHVGSNTTSNYVLAQNGGVTTVQLSQNQMPSHTHTVIADNNPATTSDPANAYYANAAPKDVYTVPNSSANPDSPIFRNMNAGLLPAQGGSQFHDNMQPYLPITFIISMFGSFPSAT